MAGEIPNTDGEPPKTPDNKIKALSLHSFWWRIVNKAFTIAKEPFENVGLACAIFAGLVALGFIFHLITQESGDYMIYWSIAFPVIVLLVWFSWNLIKAPHQLHHEDVGAAISGAALAAPVPKTRLQKLIPFFFVTVIVLAFMGILSVKNRQISELQKKLAPPKQEVVSKPVSIQTIPRPEPPPREHLQTAENKLLAVSQTNKPFENFEPDAINPDFSQVLSNKWATQVREAAEVKKKYEQKVNDLWSNDVPHFRHALTCLRDSMLHLAEKDGDGISQSDGFLQCLPDKLDPNFGAFKPAEIRFQKNTNIDFIISVEAVNGDGNRGFIISCAAGFLQMGEGSGNWHCTVNIPSASYDETVLTDANGADTNTTSSVKDLISAERYFLLHRNAP
jgi:hypothetical protein